MNERVSRAPKWWEVVIGLVAAAAVTVVIIWGFNAYRAAQAAEAAAAEQAEIQAAAQAEYDAYAIKFADPVLAELVKTPPPPPVVEAPVAEEPAEPEYVPGQSGDLVPFVPSDDPQNAAGGDYIDPGIYCINGSASGNPPVCD